MIRTQISMTEEQAERLRRLSALRNRSQAALMREALDGLGSDDLDRRIERARGVLGAHSSGGSATSEHHDDALAEAFSS